MKWKGLKEISWDIPESRKQILTKEKKKEEATALPNENYKASELSMKETEDFVYKIPKKWELQKKNQQTELMEILRIQLKEKWTPQERGGQRKN